MARDRKHKSRATRKEMFIQCQQIIVDGNPIHTTDIDRLTSRFASCIAPLLHKMTRLKGLKYQQLAMEKLLKQPILIKAMPNVVVNSKQYETTFEIVNNMREGWQGIKANHSLDEVRAKNAVNSMVVSNSTQSLTTVGQLIGTNWRILRRGQSMIIQLEGGISMQWDPTI